MLPANKRGDWHGHAPPPPCPPYRLRDHEPKNQEPGRRRLSGAAASSVRHHDFPPDAKTVSFSFASQFIADVPADERPLVTKSFRAPEPSRSNSIPQWREWLKCVHAPWDQERSAGA